MYGIINKTIPLSGDKSPFWMNTIKKVADKNSLETWFIINWCPLFLYLNIEIIESRTVIRAVMCAKRKSVTNKGFVSSNKTGTV